MIIGILATPVLYLLAAFYTGGGRTLTPMIVFFPYGVLWGRLFKTTMQWLEPILIISQFSAYGAVLGLAARRNRFKLLLGVVIVLHFIAVVAGLMLEHFHQGGWLT
jgi:hypothetical protein